MIDCIILAGGKNKGELLEQTKEEYTCLIKIRGKPMVEYVIDTLKNSKSIDKIVVVGPKEKLSFIKDKVTEIVESGDSLFSNIISGINYLSSSSKVLLAGADIPLITGEMIEHFINKCKEKQAEIYYPIIKKERILEKYPESKRTYATIKEGTFTGGNIIFADASVFSTYRSLIEQVIGSRKSVFGLVKILGLSFTIKFILQILGLRKLSIIETEKKVEQILKGKKMVAVIVDYPEIGIDVDKISDLKLVKNVLEKI